MVPVTSLLVPILLAAVIVFIVSSVIHMVLPFHKNDLKRLPKLQRLKLDSTGLTNAAVPLLKEFAGLEELSLFGTKIGGRGLATLRRALPKVNL